MATVVVRYPNGREEEHELSGELTIGRSEGNGLILLEGGVSRRHARLKVASGGLLVEDLGSANGTFVDGKRISGPTPVTGKNQVVIGDYVLVLRDGADPAGAKRGKPEPGPRMTRTMVRQAVAPTVPAPRPGPSPSLAGGEAPTLRGLNGPWMNRRYPLSGKMVIGRIAGVEIQLEDDSISRRHAEVSVGPQGVVVRDLASANGTLLNGQPLTGPATLQAGDILQLGVAELSFEDSVRKAGSPPGRRSRGPAESGPGRRPIMIAAIGGGTLLVLVTLAVKLSASSGPRQILESPGSEDPIHRARRLEQEKVSRALTQCRSYATGDGQNDPDWRKADAACNQVLEIEPINSEAIALIKKIKFEEVNQDKLQHGLRMIERLHQEEQGLEELTQIPPSSFYYSRIQPQLPQIVALVSKKAGEDCVRYSRNDEWRLAYGRCERYMTYACQQMSPDQLSPPPGYTVKLTGRLKKLEWRPSDRMYLLFLKARARAQPGAGLWKCPNIQVAKVGSSNDNRQEVLGLFEKKMGDLRLGEALFLYWQGRFGDAVVLLQSIRENQAKAALHQAADELRRNISTVEQDYKQGETALQVEDPERAVDTFREAFQIDEQLVSKQLNNVNPSYIHRSIGQELAEVSYRKGSVYADRGDLPHACKVWKTAFEFFTGDLSIAKAVSHCSDVGAGILKEAQSCGDLERVLVFATDGDGLKPRVDAKKAELGCL